MNTKTEIAIPLKVQNGSSSTRSIERTIATHPFLRGMSLHQLRLLSDSAVEEHFPARGWIFREGGPANRFYLIQKGTVGLELHVKDKGHTLIQTIGAGDVLGWSWLFPPYFWHFNARALEPTDALCLYATPLRAECDSDHELGYELMKRMAQVMLRRLQATRRQLLGLPAVGHLADFG
jgi:CRP-like cAMP-binding protein